MDNVTVYLKIRDHNPEWNAAVSNNLSRWIEVCHKLNLPYVITTGNYKNNLPKHQAEYVFSETIWDTTTVGKEITALTKQSTCEERWHGACRAHLFPYFHNQRMYTINIDADDVWHDKNIDILLPKVVVALEENSSCTLSYDAHFSISDALICFGEDTRSHHWSFGINVSKTNMMKTILYKVLDNRDPPVWLGWNNLDLMVDYYLEHNTNFPIAFVASEGQYIHGLPGHELFFGYYKPADIVWKNYYASCHSMRYGQRHPRTIVIDNL